MAHVGWSIPQSERAPRVDKRTTSNCARANFVAFTSPFAGDQSLPWTGALGNDHGSKLPGALEGSLPRSIAQIFSPYTSVYFKMLVDGEAI